MKNVMEKTRKRYVIGCDPSSGASSAFGLALYDSVEEVVIDTAELMPDKRFKKPTWLRINNLIAKVGVVIRNWCYTYDGEIEIHQEWAILYANRRAGRSNETFQKAIGGFYAIIPPHIWLRQVHNIKVKKQLTKQQKGDKMIIANGVRDRLPKSRVLIDELIANKSFDALDAIAIALCDDERDE